MVARNTSEAKAARASQAMRRPMLGHLDPDLHDILLEGFDTPRREFRPLSFPRTASPDVSIVIPAHNKFDVTYYCLAALLFVNLWLGTIVKTAIEQFAIAGHHALCLAPPVPPYCNPIPAPLPSMPCLTDQFVRS